MLGPTKVGDPSLPAYVSEGSPVGLVGKSRHELHINLGFTLV